MGKSRARRGADGFRGGDARPSAYRGICLSQGRVEGSRGPKVQRVSRPREVRWIGGSAGRCQTNAASPPFLISSTGLLDPPGASQERSGYNQPSQKNFVGRLISAGKLLCTGQLSAACSSTSRCGQSAGRGM